MSDLARPCPTLPRARCEDQGNNLAPLPPPLGGQGARSRTGPHGTATTPARPGKVTLDRDHLAALIAIARRAIRDDQDIDTVHRAQLIARTTGGPR